MIGMFIFDDSDVMYISLSLSLLSPCLLFFSSSSFSLPHLLLYLVDVLSLNNNNKQKLKFNK